MTEAEKHSCTDRELLIDMHGRIERIDERTLNQDRRIDEIRAEARSTGGKTGAAAGGGLAVVIGFLKHAIGIE